jgi:hypothetical protein
VRTDSPMAKSRRPRVLSRCCEEEPRAIGVAECSMKIFISWSGDLSHQVALALREWLPVVLPFVKTWVSSKDIPKGSRWGAELARELEETSCGIICLTPDNVKEPWLNFESGALSKQIEQASIHPFLFGISPAALDGGPLSQFQATECNSDDIQKLVSSINDTAGTRKISQDHLYKNFRTCWTILDQRLQPLLIRSGERTQTRNESNEVASKSGGTIDTILTDEDEKTLKLVIGAEGKTVFPQQIANMLGIRVERAKYIMEKLESRGLLFAAHNYKYGTSWGLSTDGRAELMTRNLL